MHLISPIFSQRMAHILPKSSELASTRRASRARPMVGDWAIPTMGYTLGYTPLLYTTGYTLPAHRYTTGYTLPAHRYTLRYTHPEVYTP